MSLVQNERLFMADVDRWITETEKHEIKWRALHPIFEAKSGQKNPMPGILSMVRTLRAIIHRLDTGAPFVPIEPKEEPNGGG